MGYLYVLIAVLSGNAKGYCGKRISTHMQALDTALRITTVRMLMCIPISLLFVFAFGHAGALSPDPMLLFSSLLSGGSAAVLAVAWLFAVRRAAYVLMDVFMMLGVFVPLSLSALLFDEHLALFDLFGVLLLVIAVLLMCSYQGKTLKRLDPTSLLLLAVCGLANGTADFSQKLFVQYAGGIPVSVFNFYSYTAASLLLGIVTLFVAWRGRHGREDAKEATVRARSLYLYVAIMAVCLFVNSYFKTLAAGRLTAVVLYPMTQGLSLITSAGMSALFFREKVTLRVALALLLAFLALLCINLF